MAVANKNERIIKVSIIIISEELDCWNEVVVLEGFLSGHSGDGEEE
jgi:hypothetical protein